MFDMKKVGAKIADLRKQKGITQMALADELGVSYQAVSNWERGNTMPDIAKLPDLATLFGVTIDEILNDKRKSEIVTKLSDGEIVPDITKEELLDIAPIISAEQLSETVKEKIEDEESDGGDGFSDMNIEDIVTFAPFLEEEMLDNLVLKAFKNKGGKCLDDVVPVLPFVSRKTLKKIATECVNKVDIDSLTAVAPFLCDDVVDELFDKLSDDIGLESLVGVAPFVNPKTLNNVALKRFDGKNIEDILPLAPFLGESALIEIAKKYIQNGGSTAGLVVIAPFLPQYFLTDLLKKK